MMAARQAAAAPMPPPALAVAASVVAAAVADAAVPGANVAANTGADVGAARSAHGVAVGAVEEPAPLDLSVEERYLATDVAIVVETGRSGDAQQLAHLTLLSTTPLLFMEGLTLEAAAAAASGDTSTPAQRAPPLRVQVLRTSRGVHLDSESRHAASEATDLLDVGQAGFTAPRAVHLRDGEGDDRFRVLVVPTAWCDRDGGDGTVLRVGFPGEFERAGVPFLRQLCDELLAAAADGGGGGGARGGAAGATTTRPVLLFRMDASRRLSGMWRVVAGIERDADLRNVRVRDFKRGALEPVLDYFTNKGPPLTEIVQPLVRVKPAHTFPLAGAEAGSPMPAELFVAYDHVVPAMVYGQPLLVAAVRVALARGHAVARAAWGLTTELRLGVHLRLGGGGGGAPAAGAGGGGSPGAYAYSDVGVAPAGGATSAASGGRAPRPMPGPLLLAQASANVGDAATAAAAAPFNVHPRTATATGGSDGGVDYLLPAHLLAQVLTVGFGDGGSGGGGSGATLPGLLPTTLAQVGLDADAAASVADAAGAGDSGLPAPSTLLGPGALGRLGGGRHGGGGGGSASAVRRIHLSRGLPRGHDRLARLGEAVLNASVTCLLAPLRGRERPDSALRPLTPEETASVLAALLPEDGAAALLGHGDWAAMLLDEQLLAYVVRRGLTRAQYEPAAARAPPAAAAAASAAPSRGARMGRRREATAIAALVPEPATVPPADTDPPPSLRRFPPSDLRQVAHALLGAVFVACGWGAAKLVAERLLRDQLAAAVGSLFPAAPPPRVGGAALQERLFAAELCSGTAAASAGGGGNGAPLLRAALACAQAGAQAELGRRAPVWLVPPAPAEKPLAALLLGGAPLAAAVSTVASPDWRLASFRAHSHAVGSALLRLAVTARLFFTLPTLEAAELGYVCGQLLHAWHTVLLRLHGRLSGLDELLPLVVQPARGGDGGANPTAATVPQLLAAYYYSALGHKAAAAATGDATALVRSASPAAVHAFWPLRLPALRIDGVAGGGGLGGRAVLSPLAAAVRRHHWSSAVLDALSYRLPASLLAAVECVFWSALRDPGPAAVLGLLELVDDGAANAADARLAYEAPHVYPVADAASVASLSRCVAVCSALRHALAPPPTVGIVLDAAPGTFEELLAKAGAADAAAVLARLRAVDAQMAAVMTEMDAKTPLHARLAAIEVARHAAEALAEARAPLHRPRSRQDASSVATAGAAVGAFDGLDVGYLAACRRAAMACALEAMLRLHGGSAAESGGGGALGADAQLEAAHRCAARCVTLLAPPLHDVPARAAVTALLLAEASDPHSSRAWPATYTEFTLAGLAVTMARRAATDGVSKMARWWAGTAIHQLCSDDDGSDGGDALAGLRGGAACYRGGAGGFVDVACVGGGTVPMSHRERIGELKSLEALLARLGVEMRGLTLPVRLGHRGARLLLQMPLPKRPVVSMAVRARRPWLAPPLQRLLTFTDQRHRASWDYVLLIEDARECRALEAALAAHESDDASPLVAVRRDRATKRVTVVRASLFGCEVVIDAGCLLHAPSSEPRIVDASFRRVATDAADGRVTSAVLCFGVEVLKPEAPPSDNRDDGGDGGARRHAAQQLWGAAFDSCGCDAHHPYSLATILTAGATLPRSVTHRPPVTELSPYSLASETGGGVGTLFDLETALAERMRMRPLEQEQQLQQLALADAGGGRSDAAGARPARGGQPTATATWTDVGEAVELTLAVVPVPGVVVLRLQSGGAVADGGSSGSAGPPPFFGIAGGGVTRLVVDVTPESITVSRGNLQGSNFANVQTFGEPLLRVELPFRVHVKLLQQLVAAVGRRLLSSMMWDEAARALRLPLPKSEATRRAGGELALCGGRGGWKTVPSAVLVDAAAAQRLAPLLVAARVDDATATLRAATAPLSWPRAPMRLLGALATGAAMSVAGANPLETLLTHRLRMLVHLLVGGGDDGGGGGGATARAGAASSGGEVWRATCISLAQLAAAAEPPPLPKPASLLQQRFAASRHMLVLVRRDAPAGGCSGSSDDYLSDAALTALGAGVVDMSTVVRVAGGSRSAGTGAPCYALLFRPTRVADGGGAFRPLLLDQPLSLGESLAGNIASVMAAVSALARARPQQQAVATSSSPSTASTTARPRRAAPKSEAERAAAVELGRALTQLQLTCEPPSEAVAAVALG